ncbi:MAG TPA: DNA polymerase III subunit gamma/tau [Candidatus Levybacteria bacterium]|nr:DNA polymerase III subunit gamma/tau [Candidatus Levybacteria bacterium]
MVYYRKYRPQLISELDLVEVRKRLSAILSSNSVPHAFLFAGPKGLGKTSSARILAKAINCEKRKQGNSSSIEPCNKCSACISITNGTAVDVLEIDAASNRGIDEIRELRERIKFSPSVLSKKVYIIDEVHMLTTEAFNALLKTLEEPPSHVVFILATTETGKLPETIISRVFLVPFEKPNEDELSRSMQRIVDGEKLELEEGVLLRVSQLSQGAFRDAAKILEELSLQAKGKITLSLVESQFKTGSIDSSAVSIIHFCFQKDLQKALSEIESLSSLNTDFAIIIERMASILHGQLLNYVLQKKNTDILNVEKLLQLLDEAYKGLKGAVLPQLPLEIAVIEFCITGSAKEVPVGEINQKDVKVQGKVRSAPVVQRENELKEKPLEPIENHIPDLFKRLLDSVNKENKILAGLLRGCKLSEDAGGFVIQAPSPFHLGKLTEKQNHAIISSHIQEILQKEVAFSIKN